MNGVSILSLLVILYRDASLPGLPAQLLNQLLGPGSDISGEVDGINALQNYIVCLHGVGPGEGRGPGQQLEHQDPQRPVVG